MTGTARPVHLGSRSQVWDIRLEDEAGRLTCVSRLTMAVIEAPGKGMTLVRTEQHERPYGSALAAILLAALAASGCGLKGALTMPPKSDEVVIRAPGQAEAGRPAEGQTSRPGARRGTRAKEVPTKPKDERIPPPPLPGGNPGTARGG